MKKLVVFFAALLLSISLAQADFTIVHFNDVYEIEPVDGGARGGAARVAALINQYDNPLVLFSGDLFSPSIMSGIFQGSQMVDVFNHLGVDYAVFGNHEFDFGPEVTLQRVSESNFPWLSTNFLDTASGQPFANGISEALVDWNGVKVGLMGLIEDWQDLTSAGDSATYVDFVEAARASAQSLEAQGAEMLIALTHMEMRNDRVLAEQVPELDLILGGHDHEFMQEVVNGTLIWKTGSDFRTVGTLKVITIPGQKAIVIPQNHNITADMPEDPAVAEVVAGYTAALDAELNQPIGETLVALDAQRATVRTQESNFGNLIADASLAFTGADVAIVNGGGIRTDALYGPGVLTRRDIFAVLPFGNVVISLEVSGADLLAALENGVSSVEAGAGRFPQVGGMSFSYNPGAAAGSRITNVTIGGSPLDPNATYVVTTNDFVGSGGDGYAMFTDAPRILSEAGGPLLAEVVINYISANAPISPEVEGRINTP